MYEIKKQGYATGGNEPGIVDPTQEFPSTGRIIHVRFLDYDCQAAIVTHVYPSEIAFTRFPEHMPPVNSRVSRDSNSWHWGIDCPAPKIYTTG